MSQTFNDIDSLIDRLKAVARQLDAADTGAEPPPPVDRQRLIARLNADPDPAVTDPTHPQLAELVVANQGDEAFLERAYRVLMGRGVDQPGRQHYLAVLPRAGRLYVLAELLCSSEARQHLETRNVVIPRRRALTLPLRAAGRLGGAGRLVRPPLKVLYRLVSIAARPRLRQQERLARLETRQRHQERTMQDVLIELDAELQRQDTDLQHHSADLQALRKMGKAQDERLAGHGEELARYVTENDRRVGELERHQPALWSALQHQRRAVERLVAEPETLPATPNVERLHQDLLDAYYLAFEDACRGSEAQIAAHLRQYQPQLDAALKVGKGALDVGCGRGEWLKLLIDQGFEARGVDLNVAMVAHCRGLGFAVEHDDAVAVLRRQPEASLALVSAFHIAEHLPFDVLYALVDAAQRALAPGGVLIVETPNPENILVGSHTFYHDPTHLNPLTPTAMEFLLTYHGFDVTVRRFNPYPESAKVPGDDPLTERVNGHLCGPQDFAVVGTKVAPAVQEASNDAQDSQEATA